MPDRCNLLCPALPLAGHSGSALVDARRDGRIVFFALTAADAALLSTDAAAR